MNCKTYPEGLSDEDGADEPYCEAHYDVGHEALAHEMSHGLYRVHDRRGEYIDSAASLQEAREMAGGDS